MKRFLLSIILGLSMVFAMPIVVPALQNTYTVQAASVKINKNKLTLNVKENYTLKIKGTSKKVKWSTSNKKIATISSKGKVTAKKKGNVTITAKVSGKKYKCKIKVEKPTLNKGTTKLALNQKETIRVTGTTQKIKWSSENNTIATVSSNGTISPKKVGTTYVVAKIGSTKYKCKVKVVEPNYKSNIKLSYQVIDDDILITVKNNNSCQVDYVGISINFYKNNNLVEHTYTNEVCIAKNEFSYAEAFIPKKRNAEGKYVMVDYDTIELIPEDVSVYPSSLAYKNMKSKVSVKHSKPYDKVVGTITNNSDIEIGTAELFVFYYKDGKLVGWSSDLTFGIEDNSTKTFEVSKYYNSSIGEYGDYVDYDSYKLVVNRVTK